MSGIQRAAAGSWLLALWRTNSITHSGELPNQGGTATRRAGNVVLRGALQGAKLRGITLSEDGARSLNGGHGPLVDPFDPVALAARLAEARALRAVALAKKKQLVNDDARDGRKPGRAEERARPAPHAVAPEAASATSGVLRADPRMRVAFGPPRGTGGALAPGYSNSQTSEVPRSNGSASVIVGLVAGCIIAGTAVLAFRPAPLPERPADINPPQPDTVFQPTIVQAPAPLASPLRSIGSPIEQALPVPAVPRQAGASEFVAASGQTDIAANEFEGPPPLAPRPAARANPGASDAPRLRPYDTAVLLDRPRAPVLPRPTRPVDAFQVPAPLPAVAPPRTVETTSVTPAEPFSGAVDTRKLEVAPGRAERATTSPAKASASYLEYRLAAENLRTPPEFIGAPTPSRSTSAGFRLADLPDFSAPIRLPPASLRLESASLQRESDEPPAQPIAPTERARVRAASPARAASPVRPATPPDPGQPARVGGVEQSELERRIDRLLREQLRELRRR